MSEIVNWVEIDYDFCSRTFGVGACGATLSSRTPSKCYNTTVTCSFRQALNLQPKVLRFVTPNSGAPLSGTWFPALVSVSDSSSTVNIAGANPDLDPLGKRAEITARFNNFTYHDRTMDKYWRERISGSANFSGVGVAEVAGTFFGRMRARWPYYAGRALRKCSGRLVNGVLTPLTVRHYVMTEMEITRDGDVIISASDELWKAGDKNAQAPKAVNGVLAADIAATGAATVSLSPAGIGNQEYPASGWAKIGSEIVSYARSGDVLTINGRGTRGTTAASHSAGDSVQPTFSLRRVRIDTAIRMLLVDFANINPAFIPFAKWQAEANRWAPSLMLTVDIASPEGVSKLIGELAILGVSIWWDDVRQEVGFKMARPPDRDFVRNLSDRNSFITFEVEDRDADRITTVQMYSVILDPTKSATDSANYARQQVTFDVGAASAPEYNGTRFKEIHCRWLNHGDDGAVSVLAGRYLSRFVNQPQRFRFTVDRKDDMGLTDVAAMISRDLETFDGSPLEQLVEIISRKEVGLDRIEYTAQAFFLGLNYAYYTENSRPSFTASTPAQKARGAYWADDTTKLMSDGSPAYRYV